jgi:hypothetical protein
MGTPSPDDMRTRGRDAVEDLNVIKLTRAPARFRAFPDDARVALEGDKPVACVGPILKLLDGEVIAGLAAGTAAEECPRDIDHVRRALAFVKQRSPAPRAEDVVDNLNLTALDAVYGDEQRGQPPYDPRMMTKVLLPRGFVKIRHFGFLANRGREDNIRLCRSLLDAQSPNVRDAAVTKQPQPNPPDRCPLCKEGSMRPLEILLPQASALSRSPIPISALRCDTS